MTQNSLLILLCLALCYGCSGEREDDSRPALPASLLPGVYAGEFPCEGCQGIPTTLWLRADGRFIVEQAYPATANREAMKVHSLGRWRRTPDSDDLVLQGEGPDRIFTRLNRDTLAMQTETDQDHYLHRDATGSDFKSAIRMSGMIHMHSNGALFKECLAGFAAPVNKDGDYSRFWHQYRSAGALGRATYVELEGRFSWSETGALRSLTIERFVTVKASGVCPTI